MALPTRVPKHVPNRPDLTRPQPTSLDPPRHEMSRPSGFRAILSPETRVRIPVAVLFSPANGHVFVAYVFGVSRECPKNGLRSPDQRLGYARSSAVMRRLAGPRSGNSRRRSAVVLFAVRKRWCGASACPHTKPTAPRG